jgi:hypothetical protein
MPKAVLFVVTPELQQVLENLPEDAPRSRLDPFRPFILRWRREGRSYRKIQQILADECKVRVHNETLRRFVKRRSRPRKPQPEPEAEQLPVAPAAPIQPGSIPDQPPRTFTKLSPEEAARRRDLLQSLRKKHALEPKPAVLEEFKYDPDKPLTIDRTIKD